MFRYLLLILLVQTSMTGEPLECKCTYCMMEKCASYVPPDRKFNVEEDVQKLVNAHEESLPFEEILTEILFSRTEEQRLEISHAYYKKQKRYLQNDIVHNRHIEYEDLLLAMLAPLELFLSQNLYSKLINIDDGGNGLSETMANIPSCLMRKVSTAFYDVHGYTLDRFVKNAVSGDLKDLLRELVKGTRDECSPIDMDSAMIDANKLVNAGVERWGTDEDIFINIFTKRSYPQLRKIFVQYSAIRGKDDDYKFLEDDIYEEYEFGATWTSPKRAYSMIVKNIRNQPQLLSVWLDQALVEKNNYLLTYVVRFSFDIHIADVKAAYEAKGRSLELQINTLVPIDGLRMQLLAAFNI